MHVNELFDMVDTQPVASGSIGQIHRAILNARGAALTGKRWMHLQQAPCVPGTWQYVALILPGDLELWFLDLDL